MKVYGITGGVGAGKSRVLSYIEDHYKAKIILADRVAHELEEPGTECFTQLVALLGNDVLQENGCIDKLKMANMIFSDKSILNKVNAIIHPAVKKYIIEVIDSERKKNEIDYLFVEAALLIEEHYDEILDDIWYVYASEEVRAKRLREERNYSEEKIRAIMKGQLSEEDFRKHCKVVIPNNGDINETYHQIDLNLSKCEKGGV